MSHYLTFIDMDAEVCWWVVIEPPLRSTLPSDIVTIPLLPIPSDARSRLCCSGSGLSFEHNEPISKGGFGRPQLNRFSTQTGLRFRVFGCGLRVADPVTTGFFCLLLLKTGHPERFYPSTQPGFRVVGRVSRFRPLRKTRNPSLIGSKGVS